MTGHAGSSGPGAWSAFDLAEAFHLACALAALERTGVLKSLAGGPTGAAELAATHRVDPKMLEGALRFLGARTEFISSRAGKYRLTDRYDERARSVVLQYLGAYGRNAVELDSLLRRLKTADSLIDRERHAEAFSQVTGLHVELLRDLIVQLDFNHVLDLGCGTGALLVSLADRSPEFVGWGIDLNPWMCAAARKRVAAAGVTGRVAIIHGDCRNGLAELLARGVIGPVHTLTAASVANEFFSDGEQEAIAWLDDLRGIFPGRVMLLADYYGRLGRGKNRSPPEILLHDFIQLISGQGIPPGNLRTWKRIYRAAGCSLIHGIEDDESTFFVHIIKLG